VGERSSWGGRDYHNGGDYFPLEQCLPPEDILRGRHNSVTPAPIRMTLNDLECPIQLKVRLVDGTLDVRLLRVSDSTIRINVA